MTSKCALVGRPCPETADATKRCYCPLWVEGIPEVERDGSGRLVAETIYRGCFVRRLPLYLVSVTASAGQSAASADQARNAALEARDAAARSPLTLLSGLAALASAGAPALPPGDRAPLLVSAGDDDPEEKGTC